MTQFVKIPKQMIKNYPGSVIKVYGALESHCRKNKTFCYPGNKRLTKLTGIKTKATLVAAKKILERDSWIKIQERKGKSNTYVLPQTNFKFKMIPIESLQLSNSALKLYCILLYITPQEKTETTLKNIKKISGIREGRTIRKCMLELVDKNFINIIRFPSKYITNWKIHKINVGIFEPLCGKNYTTMWEKLNYYVGIFEPEANYVEVRLLEVNFVKQGKSEKISQHRETHIDSDTNPNSYSYPADTNPNAETNVLSDIDPDTDPNANTEQEEKESFVAESDSANEPDINKMTGDEFREYMAQIEAEEPPKINRSAVRKKYKADLSQEKFYEFLDAKKAGFNGDAESVQKYVEIETKLWDYKKRPMDKEALQMKFEKEYWIGHPIAKRFKEMTEEQRNRELQVQ